MMKQATHGFRFHILILSGMIFLLSPLSSARSRIITQIKPTLTVTEEYDDNLLRTDTNKKEEFITSYELGVSIGFLDRKSQVYLNYNPEYKEYKNFSGRGGLENNASLTGSFQPSKHTRINADLSYDGHSGNHTGESWENTASVSLDSQLTKYTGLTLSQVYSKSYDQQVRTGIYKEHEINTSSAGVTKQFGKKDSMGLDFTYAFDNYNTADADEYTKYTPSGFITYWFTPFNGLETRLEFEKTDFTTASVDDITTWDGSLRYIRKMTKHFDWYLKYEHSFSQRDSGDHQVFHPSVGFDWKTTKDSGISLGIGALFNKWDNENDDSTNPFIDLNAYKVFNFSRRTSLSITGSSSYNDSSTDAASLGYNTDYQAGFSFDHQILKRLSSNLFGSYELQNFYEKAVNRRDDTIEVGGGLTWSLLRWLQLSLSGSHINYSTDGARGDYKDNQVTFFVTLIPERPIRPDKIATRQALEQEIFSK